MANTYTETQTQAQTQTQDQTVQPTVQATENEQKQDEQLQFAPSDHLADWFAKYNISLVFTSYQAGRIFFIGRNQPEGISLFQRHFPRSMGVAVSENTIYLSSLNQIWKFNNSLLPGEAYRDYDKLFIPQMSYTTGDIDIHDMAIDKNGRLVFVNTLFSCLSSLSENYSFDVVWKPPFITKIVPEDRCHLNGLALKDGLPKYVTLFSQTNSFEAWRAHKESNGLVMDIESNEIVCHGLSMPHSPRMHEGRLWLLNSGTGFLGYVDEQTGRFEEVVFCPGYVRGLDFVDHYAIVGLSHLRDSNFMGVRSLKANLEKHNNEIKTGMIIVDLRNGEICHSFEVGGAIQEVYDVYALNNAVKPMALGIMNDGLRRAVVLPIPGETIAGELIVLNQLRETKDTGLI